MDGRTVEGRAQSGYAGASTGLLFPLSRRLALDLNLRWEVDFFETLFSEVTRRSVTGPERELSISGDGPLATQLRNAAVRESANKDLMTDTFKSQTGYVQTWSMMLGVSYLWSPP